MTEIPRLVQEAQLLIQLVEKAAHTQQYGSFAARDPTLGKMIKCSQCGRRHRQSEICGTYKINHPIVFGKSLVKGKRLQEKRRRCFYSLK